MMAHDLSRRPGMSLARLLEGVVDSVPDVPVTDITLDSRQVSAGGAFLACQGILSHGLAYLDVAVSRGVRAVVR